MKLLFGVFSVALASALHAYRLKGRTDAFTSFMHQRNRALCLGIDYTKLRVVASVWIYALGRAAKQTPQRGNQLRQGMNDRIRPQHLDRAFAIAEADADEGHACALRR